jgi:hypothetical protein
VCSWAVAPDDANREDFMGTRIDDDDNDAGVMADFVPDPFAEGLGMPELGDVFALAGESVKNVDRGIRRFVTERPVVAVAAAVAAGFVVGRLLSRRR